MLCTAAVTNKPASLKNKVHEEQAFSGKCLIWQGLHLLVYFNRQLEK